MDPFQGNQTDLGPCPSSTIYILQSGGTIDKDYPRKACGYAFEICEPAAKRILTKAFLNYSEGSPDVSGPSSSAPFVIEEVLREDSLDMTDAHREKLLAKIVDLCGRKAQKTSTRVLITHGTDTMLETGQYIASRIQHINFRPSPIVVLTGSLLPEKFKDTDADFNLGLAIGALQCISRPGVYIACTGQVIPVEHAGRMIATGKFFNLLGSETR